MALWTKTEKFGVRVADPSGCMSSTRETTRVEVVVPHGAAVERVFAVTVENGMFIVTMRGASIFKHGNGRRETMDDELVIEYQARELADMIIREARARAEELPKTPGTIRGM